MRLAPLIAAAAILLTAPAGAQSSLGPNVPAWARELITADFDTINGGRSSLVGLEQDIVVRVTIVPREGGVARVIRYEQEGEDAVIALRRFTGHPQQGWWLWGPDTPAFLTIEESEQAEIARLVRSAMGVGRVGAPAEDESAPCPSGEAAYVEIAQGQASPYTTTRSCIGTDAASALSLRLSELAGSRDERELQESAVAELLAQDRAFAAAAEADGVPAAFQAFARDDALFFYPGREPFEGAAGIDQRFADWDADARLLWEPRAARVSVRGDMGWTWGDGLFVQPNGETFTSTYVSIWARDLDGVWKWVVDIGIRGPEDPNAELARRAANSPADLRE
jgi:ketosteroid isomerase-like protein